MKTLLTILILALSLTSCKKDNKKPVEPPPPPVVCTDKAPIFMGAYYTYNTGSVDTCYLTLIDNNCSDKSRYQIVNLSAVFATWATSIDNKVYTVSNNTLKSDSVVLQFKPNNILQISAKNQSGSFTPYLNLRKRN